MEKFCFELMHQKEPEMDLKEKFSSFMKTQYTELKIESMILFWKWGFWVKKFPKWIYEFRFFLIFCIKLKQHKTWKSSKIILTKFLFWGFGGQKGLKMAPNEVFNFYFILKHDMPLMFYMKLVQLKGLRLPQTLFGVLGAEANLLVVR